MLNFTIFRNANTDQWITFVHGAGGSSSIWFKQIRDFQKHANVLLLDLRGHGESKHYTSDIPYTFSFLASDINEVLDHLKIRKTHFIGISLGTILIRQLAEMHPDKIQSMTLGGAIFKMNFRAQVLMRLGTVFQYVVPYLWLYRFFAYVIMPRKNHKSARSLFVNEAKKMNQKEFMKWYVLTAEVNPILRKFRNEEVEIPTLFIMGEQDYMFLPTIKKLIAEQKKYVSMFIIPNCGHVVNVEKAEIFNKEALHFIGKLK